MKNLMLVLIGTMFLGTTTAQAGVLARDMSGGVLTYKGVFAEIVCEKGIECGRNADKLVLTVNSVKTVSTFASSDATPSVASGSFFNTGSGSQTITAFDDGTLGQQITVTSKAAITYDVTSTTLKCGTTDIVTALNDITVWVFDGTNWYCTSRVKASGDMN